MPEYLTVRELADLLRVKERTVYDLAAAGEVPCSRATGKLLFPERGVRAWIDGASSGGGAAGRPAVFLGSNDPLLEWALRQSRCGLATYLDGSLDGLSRFCGGEGVATGLHVHDRATGDWNVPVVAAQCAYQAAVLATWAVRRRGLVVREADHAAIGSLADLSGRRLASRQSGSGTQVLFEHLCAEAGIPLDEIEVTATARSEGDVVLAVAQGTADCAFGLEVLARRYGLAFQPVVEERFDLLVDRRAWFEPPMQRLLDFCRSGEFRARSTEFAGYVTADLGRIRWNGA